MSNLLPLDLPATIHQSLRASKRTSDGLLHCSGDLVGSLRHVQLREAGAPEKLNDMVADTILEIGTLMHRRVAEAFVGLGLPFMQEVRLDTWLPAGWGGTADWIFYHPEYEAFVLGDLKTTTGEGLPFIAREGIKETHHHQLSAYWHALVRLGLPMVRGVAVLYMPKNRAKNTKTEPLVVEAEPLDEQYLLDLMNDRRQRVDAYLSTMQDDLLTVYQRRTLVEQGLADFSLADVYVTPELAEVQERVLKIVWSKDHFDVKLVPHWSAQFCPYDSDLCDCSSQGETKVGEYKLLKNYDDEYEVVYLPRRGYEQVNPTELDASQRRKLESYGKAS